MDFISILSIFVLACFVGYYVVWSVTPALHTPLMAVTNAISSVIIVGALIAAAALDATNAPQPIAPSNIGGSIPAPRPQQPSRETGTIADTFDALPDTRPPPLPLRAPEGTGPAASPWAKWLGLIAVVLASVNIFGGFAVTARMLAMYKKKER
jgi:NAD(P) transhydrogenase subunit alpha